MNRLSALLLILAAAAAAPALAQQPTVAPGPSLTPNALSFVTEDAIRAHVKFLSSDLLEGRGPGSRGDAIATQYIASQLEALGLQPAGDEGSFFQKVSLLGLTYDQARSSVTLRSEKGPAMGPLTYLEQFVGLDQSQKAGSTLDSEMVFVGHGVVAPEYKWDDYKGLDVRGKTLVMFVDDPPATGAEPDLFRGNARTYYGRWTYKFESGAARGAQAVVLIHTNQTAGYGWQVVRNSWGSESSFTKLGAEAPSLRFAGWMTEAVARELFKNAGHDFDTLRRSAASRNFKPVPLGYRMTGNLATTIRPFETSNVVARAEGSDPTLKEEAVLYTAHHDHLGIGTADATGDRVYNGAVDNATGTAVVMEIARAWMNTTPRPKRSALFAMVAAEEQGLLGSEWFARKPAVPAGRIALALNFDAIFMIGRVRDVTMIGVERTTFNSTAESVTKSMGMNIVPDQDPQQGFYYRSDHFPLAKGGILAFSVDGGHEVAGKPEEWGRKKSEEYREKSYHQPSDEIADDWDWSSGLQMVELGYRLGWEAANAATMPNWLPGEEFRAARDKAVAVK